MSHTPPTPASIDPDRVPASVASTRPEPVETIGMGFFPDELGLSGPASAWLPAVLGGRGA